LKTVARCISGYLVLSGFDGMFGWDAHTSPDPATGGYTMFTLHGAEGDEVACGAIFSIITCAPG
jgi:hypothetical protein